MMIEPQFFHIYDIIKTCPSQSTMGATAQPQSCSTLFLFIKLSQAHYFPADRSRDRRAGDPRRSPDK
ncbi:hypothetical protein CEXT_459881 [Caerostris extrusa]|uniref:Uncharacterized protein n=1 Tax=Caerostris extrusa TaxID=172846 RepID=A0AAV4X4A9_CAEEX|nr:hypothetical protein CEXT_459881 [Caerostris extrusa]